jgi:glycosyltransferase involved in cell wall biosynthesis
VKEDMREIFYISAAYADVMSGQSEFDKVLLESFERQNDTIVHDLRIARNDRKYFHSLNKNNVFSLIFLNCKIFFYIILKSKQIKNKELIIYNRFSVTILSHFFVSYFSCVRIITRTGPFIDNIKSYQKIRQNVILILMKKIFIYALNRSNKIICVTDIIKESLLQIVPRRAEDIFVYHNPIDEILLNKRKMKNEKDFIKANNEKFNFTFVGTIYEDQGLQELINCLPDLINIKEGVELNIYGAGNYSEHLKDLSKSKQVDHLVIFHGSVAKTEIPRVIGKSDVCVAPFTLMDYLLRGSSSLKVPEYLYCGKPVVTIDVPEYQYIKRLKFGELYAPSDKASLLKALKRVISNKSSYADANSYVSKMFNPDATAVNYLKGK